MLKSTDGRHGNDSGTGRREDVADRGADAGQVAPKAGVSTHATVNTLFPSVSVELTEHGVEPDQSEQRYSASPITGEGWFKLQ